MLVLLETPLTFTTTYASFSPKKSAFLRPLAEMTVMKSLDFPEMASGCVSTGGLVLDCSSSLAWATTYCMSALNSSTSSWPSPSVSNVDHIPSARAGNSRFGRLSALRGRAKMQHEPDLRLENAKGA